MTTLSKLKRDLETVQRALVPRDNSKGEEISRLLKAHEEYLDAFERLPTEEKQRLIENMEATPATEFTGGDPELAVYAEALKKSAIRNLEARMYDNSSDDSEGS